MQLVRRTAFLALAALQPACGGFDIGGVPVASAGPDAVAVVDEPALLDGSGSSYPYGTFSYAWSFLSRPPGSTATLSYPSTASPTFIPDLAGTYVVQLTIDAGGGLADSDAVTVVAAPAPAGPRARAGPDVRVGLGGKVWVDGRASVPPPGAGVTYAWSLLSKPAGSAATISGTDPSSFDADVAGEYVLRLSVTEGASTSQDDVRLTAVPLLGTPQTLVTAGATESAAIGDVTGDGRADLVFSTGTSTTLPDDAMIHVAAGNPAGGLETALPYAYLNPGTAPASVALGDVNGDGRIDVVVGVLGGLSVHPQNAGGTLDPGSFVASAYAEQAYRIVAGDFTQDGRTDVAALTGAGSTKVLELYVQSAGGVLGAAPSIPYGSGAQLDLEAGDLNGDGRPDLVAMSGSLFAFDNLAVFHGLAGGGLSGPTYHDLGLNENTYGLGVGDLNGDGRDDAAASWGGNVPASLSFFLQGSDGALGAPRESPAWQVPDAVELGDLDGDGRRDAVVVNAGHNGVSAHLQSADGRFGAWTVYTVLELQWAGNDRLALGDLNGDGKLDVVCATTASQPDLRLMFNLGP